MALTNYEKHLISALAMGASINQLPAILKSFDLEAHSLSSVEKNLRSLKKRCGCRTNAQLVYEYHLEVIDLNLDELLKA